MCLEIIAIIPQDAKRRVGARRLSRETGLYVSKVTFEDTVALYFSTTGGCSCGFLGDNVDFNASVWNLDPKHLSALIDALSLLAKEARKFSFLAYFDVTERERTSQVIRWKEFLRIAQSNQIGNNVFYHIH
ncbi:hypothetical protein JXA32_06215 [Candidatus Sumerlaeota bacterium]|nr:hypothetical protein [Candidatus Sumerlaeota bacterium]